LNSSDLARIDPAEVAALFLEHGEELRRFLIGVIGDPQLAGDVLQSTLARLIERGHETREASRKAWLFRVAYHEALAIRRRDAVGQRATRQAAWSRKTCEDGADQPVIRLETVEKVRSALDELPPEQQQVVRMKIYEEKTFAQIASELGIPLGTALGRMRTALAKLRKRLGEP
jgi:RNA polymerase sigma-70 factor (ECF subfamily)